MEARAVAPKERRAGRSVLLRVIAVLLAVVLLFSVVVSILVRVVKPQQKTVSMGLVEQAYAQLAEDDAYLNASVVERVGRLFRTVGVTPATVSDYEQLASMYIGRGNYEEARYLYEQAAALVPPEQEVTLANLYYRLGSVCVLGGDVAGAEDYYTRVLDYGVSSELIHMLMAQVCLEQQKYAEAARQLEIYLLYQPEDAASRELYANALEVSGDLDAAAEQYALLLDATVNPDRRLDIARTSLLLEDYATVVEQLTRYLETNEDPDGSLHCMRGMAALWSGDVDMAIADLNTAEEGGYADEDGSLHYMRGVAYLSAGEYEKGEADLLTAVERNYADLGECYLQLSLGAYLAGDYEKTIQYGALSNEHAAEPDAECLQRMGLAAMQLERYDEAMAHLKNSLDIDPALTLNHYFLATLYFMREDFEHAAEAYTAAIDGEVYAQECLYNRALCYLQLNKMEEATADLMAAYSTGDDMEVREAARDILAQLGVKVS